MSNLYREVKIVGHRKKRIYHKKQEKNNYTNDLDFSVKHWIYKNNLKKERLSFPSFHLKYNDYNQLINMVESNTQMHQAIRKIANHKRIDWRRKSQRIEEIIKSDVYTNHVYTQLLSRNARSLKQNNGDSVMGWGIGVNCGCDSAPKCCLVIAALIVILIL